jgi:prepilin-type N-terminal cleavage/methylation domain-containing protein
MVGSKRQYNPDGFSLLEILVVVAIGLILAVVAIPKMNNVIANMKLRSSMSTVSGFLQNVRTVSISKNKTTTARHFNRSAAPYSLIYYSKVASDTSDITSKDSQVELEAPISPYNAPTGPGAPGLIPNSALGTTSNPSTADPSFNSRGLPCVYSSGTCSSSAFIKYFKDNRINTEGGGWAAISITPAGRIKRWFWNGSAWVD